MPGVRVFSDVARQIARDIRARAPFQVFEGLTLAQAYDVQDALSAELGPVGGYKIAWNGPGLPQKFGMEVPAVARVLAADLMQTGVALDASDFRQPTLEPEIAAVLAQDVPALGVPYTAETIRPYIGAYKVAFEVLDRRDVAAPHGESIIAGGVFNRGAVLGAESVTVAPTGATTLDLDGARLLEEATDSAPQHPEEAVAYVANLMLPRGAQLGKDMVILCGSHCGLLTIAKGSHAHFECAGLGAVTCSMV